MFRYRDFRMGKIKGTEKEQKGTESNWLRFDFFLAKFIMPLLF